MEETAQNFEKRLFMNRSQIFIALPKFYVTYRIYEILSKSLVPSVQQTFLGYGTIKNTAVLGVYTKSTDISHNKRCLLSSVLAIADLHQII